MIILKENNELENRANKHKKKDKGLGWYIAVNPDKGNPKSMEIFNNSTADGGIGEVASMGEDLNESKEDKMTLYYSKLPVERFDSYTPATYWQPAETSSYSDEIEYEYEVDISDVEETIGDLITEEDYPKYDTATDEEFWKFISDNFDTLFDKYEKQILDKYEKDAIEEWEDKYYFDESLKESLHGKKRYVYDGPVYFDGKRDRIKYKKRTAAESPAKAINNIKWTLCNGNKLWYNRIDLDLDKLVCLDNDVPNDTSMDEYDDTPHICVKCGYKLNDAGECPICDLGDYTALDEEISISEALFRLKD